MAIATRFPLLALTLSALLAEPLVASTYVAPIEVDSAAARKAERAERDFCRKALRAKGRVERLLPIKGASEEQVADWAWLLTEGAQGCPKDLDLAVAVYEALIGGRSSFAVSTGLLGDLRRALTLRGHPDDLVRAEELSRVQWVRWIDTKPQWSAEEQRRFIARHDVWGFISQEGGQSPRARALWLDALVDPLSTRFDPVKGLTELELRGGSDGKRRAALILLEGKLVPADPVRAEPLLWEVAVYDEEILARLFGLIAPRLADSQDPRRRDTLTRLGKIVVARSIKDPALRERIGLAFVPDLTDRDPAVQRTAASTLLALVRTGAVSFEPSLLDWAERSLTGQDPDKQRTARYVLAQLVYRGSPSASQALNREYDRHGGLVQGGDWTPDPIRPVPFAKILRNDDFPVSAQRREIEGVVEASAVIGPDGRVLLVEVIGSPDAALAQAVITTVTRRLRRSFAEHPGRYVRVRLPPIQFRLLPCESKRAPADLVPVAVLVQAQQRCNHPSF